MRIFALTSALVACFFLASCGSHDTPVTDADRSKAISELATSVVQQRGVPGLALAVIRDGKPFQKLTLGSSDLEKGDPVSGSTPFQLASTTKIFSSTAVLLLVADNKVSLEGPIGDYLPGLPATWRSVTVRQLLSHTSGLPDITRTTGELDMVAPDWEGALAAVATRPFQFQPGQGWAYNQTNYALLQRLIEAVSGSPFESFLEERLFRPVGMRNTFFPGERQCAVNYERSQDGKIVKRDLSFPRYVHAAGGLCSSLDDLTAFAAAYAAGKIVPAALAEQASAPTRLANGSNAQVGGAMSYGLGWAVDPSPGHRWAGHSGGNSTALRRYLDDKLTIIVLHNGASDPDAIANALAQAMLRQNAGDGAQADLWDAAGSGNAAAIKAALAAGADIKALDTRTSRNGRFALNWAAVNNHPEAIKQLLSAGAPIDAQNLSGFTALHHAAESGSAEAAQALVAAGASTSLRTAGGKTAAEVARRNEHPAIAQLIEAASRKTG